MIFAPPPIRAAYPQEGSPRLFSRDWVQWFQAIADRFTTLIISNVAPATAASPGIAGQIAYDANFIYIAVDKNTWKRAPIATW